MQKVRGFIYFPDKTLDEIKGAHNLFRNISIHYFKSLCRNEIQKEAPGIFISGEVEDRYSSESLTHKLQETAGVEKIAKNCDISIESEDYMKHIKEGHANRYIGLRIRPPYEFSQIENIAKRMSKNSNDVYIRGVETEAISPLACIDLLANDYNIDELKNHLLKQNLKPGPIVYFDLL